MKHLAFLVAAAGAAISASPANAAVTLVTDKCVSVSDTAGCLFQGNILAPLVSETQTAYNFARDPDISLSLLFTSIDGAGFLGSITTNPDKISGTWSTPGFLVSYLAARAGPEFVLYKINPASDGTWSTSGLINSQSGNPRELGHLAFFGEAIAVPEPASWAMMIAGFGFIGGAMRVRRRKVAFG